MDLLLTDEIPSYHKDFVFTSILESDVENIDIVLEFIESNFEGWALSELDLIKSIRDIATKVTQQIQVDRLNALLDKPDWSQSDKEDILQSIEIAKNILKWNEERLPELMIFYETLPEEEVDIDYDDEDDSATNIYLSFKAILLSILFLSIFLFSN